MKFKFEIKDLFKLPNILCYLRILMVPLFLHVYFTAETPHDYYLATLIVLASGITDFLDGQIARRCNMITDLGKVIDPVADKLMQLAMLVALMFRVPYMYLLVIYLVVKEVVSTVYQLEDGASQAQWCKVVWESVYSPAVCSYAHYGSLPTAFRWVSENASAGMCRSDDSFFCNVSSHLHYNVY